jgi:hypothetical protein
MVQVNQSGLKLIGTRQILVYANDINVLGGSEHTMKKNTHSLVVTGRETGLKKMLIKLSTRSCLEIRMQDEFSI